MAGAVYILGFLVALACGVLLMRGYVRGRKKLLLWSSLCFIGLSLSNFLVFLDLVIFPTRDLYSWRLLIAAVAMLFLLYGLIWEGDS
jgi:Family of unknown function (DUF5985)